MITSYTGNLHKITNEKYIKQLQFTNLANLSINYIKAVWIDPFTKCRETRNTSVDVLGILFKKLGCAGTMVPASPIGYKTC